MARRSSALAALAEDPGLVSSIYMTIRLSSSRGFNTIFWPLRALGIHMARDKQAGKYLHTYKIK